MKKEYKRYITLLYCYDYNSNITVRVDTEDMRVTTYPMQLSDWVEPNVYEECTKKEFKTALSAAIKKIREVTK